MKLQVRHNSDLDKDGGRDDENYFIFGLYVRGRTNRVTIKHRGGGRRGRKKEKEND